MAHYYDPFPPYAVHDPFPLVDPYYMNANPFWPPPNAMMMPPAPMMQQPFASFNGGPLYGNFGFGGYPQQSQPMGYPRYNSPRYASPIDAEFEVIDEADELFEEMMEEEAWMSDGERARRRRMDREMGEPPFGGVRSRDGDEDEERGGGHQLRSRREPLVPSSEERRGVPERHVPGREQVPGAQARSGRERCGK